MRTLHPLIHEKDGQDGALCKCHLTKEVISGFPAGTTHLFDVYIGISSFSELFTDFKPCQKLSCAKEERALDGGGAVISHTHLGGPIFGAAIGPTPWLNLG